MTSKQVVLFLCSQNSARSQMAEGLLRHMAGDQFKVHSVGMEPADLHSLAVRGMQEIGIDISGHRTKPAGEFLGHLAVHHLLIVCGQAAESCPSSWPGVRTRDVWPFPDPAQAAGSEEERLQFFREVRDAICERIDGWLERGASVPDDHD